MSNRDISHADFLASLNEDGSLKSKLVSAHRALQVQFPFIARIAITLYDQETNLIKTYLHSSEEADPLEHYQSELDKAPSLKKILEQGKPRIINNLVTTEDIDPEHHQRIARAGYKSSYTVPMFNHGEFFGFLFFNSFEKEVFNEKSLHELDLFAHLISLMVINELQSLRVLNAALKTTGQMTHYRDPETGSHLDRMSRYSRLIAKELAGKYDLDDEYIEHVFMFSPLHDIGKMAIPDNILLKPDKLDNEEFEIMRAHPELGLHMIDNLIQNFALNNIEHLDLLRNIALHHHEAVNGHGYPEGRKGDEIPLEARIVAVADVFDALTSKRPYKEAWSNEKAFVTLRDMAGEQLDSDCVDALIKNEEHILEIQRNFKEDPYGLS